MNQTGQRIRIDSLGTEFEEVLKDDQKGILKGNTFIPLSKFNSYTYLNKNSGKKLEGGDKEKMSLELEVEDRVEIPDGKKSGKVTKVEERTEPYHYIDIYVSCEGHDVPELKFGAPAKITKSTKLGRTLSNFVNLRDVIGQKVDLEEILVGERVQYMTMQEETEQGTFTKIVEDSLKPVEEESDKEKVLNQSKGED